MSAVRVRYEQAVYGSFPFWDKGYAVLARSPGCRDEWISDLRAACQRYGERPAGAADAGGLLALRLPSGPWAIIGPCPQGCDDRGRPGALAFHALFLSGADYRKAGAFPFDLASRLRADWTDESTSLLSGELSLDNIPPAEPSPNDDPLAARIANALARGKRVALETPGPIDDLARKVWLALPLRRRARLSLATWTFANGNRHDLAALPRLASIVLDRSYIDPATLCEHTPLLVPSPPRGGGLGWGGGTDSMTTPELARHAPPPPHPSPTRREDVWARKIRVWSPGPLWGRVSMGGFPLSGRLFWLCFAIIAVTILGFAWHPPRTLDPPRAPTTPQAAATPIPPRPDPPQPLTPLQRRQIDEGLISLAERFGTLESPADLSPDALMARLRERLVYRDSFLTSDELSELAQSHAPDWHAHILRFLPDRPLPDDFARSPLDRQLHLLAWSFHLDPGNRPAQEIPHFLSESLSLPFSIHATPPADHHPALNDYARFLRRLPTR